MSDYLLFVDTETSGWPRDWQQPYSADGIWPYVVQVAWIVFHRSGQKIKTENHFISDDDFTISPASQQIHGITREVRIARGMPRKAVFSKLTQDLLEYCPLVVGYFLQLDYHMIGAEYHRLQTDNPLLELPTFCLMKSTARFNYFSHRNYQSLDGLYESLFRARLNNYHDALADVQATARCFFEMEKQGRITGEVIARQESLALSTRPSVSTAFRRIAVALGIVSMIALLAYWLLT